MTKAEYEAVKEGDTIFMKTSFSQSTMQVKIMEKGKDYAIVQLIPSGTKAKRHYKTLALRRMV